jgi:hypothetical protein
MSVDAKWNWKVCSRSLQPFVWIASFLMHQFCFAHILQQLKVVTCSKKREHLCPLFLVQLCPGSKFFWKRLVFEFLLFISGTCFCLFPAPHLKIKLPLDAFQLTSLFTDIFRTKITWIRRFYNDFSYLLKYQFHLIWINVESSCDCGNETSGSIKVGKLVSVLTTESFLSSVQFHRVSYE